MQRTRLILAVSGASGMPLAHRLLTHLHALPHVDTHLILSRGAERVMLEEGFKQREVFSQLADKEYDANDMAAGPASGSWQHAGMIICPCSMSTLGSIAHGFGSTLIHRAADVTLKERRPLIIVPRESPYSAIHLSNMHTLCQAGACIMPFHPAFYIQDTSIEGMMQHFCGRILDHTGIAHDLCDRWQNNH